MAYGALKISHLKLYSYETLKGLVNYSSKVNIFQVAVKLQNLRAHSDTSEEPMLTEPPKFLA